MSISCFPLSKMENKFLYPFLSTYRLFLSPREHLFPLMFFVCLLSLSVSVPVVFGLSSPVLLHCLCFKCNLGTCKGGSCTFLSALLWEPSVQREHCLPAGLGKAEAQIGIFLHVSSCQYPLSRLFILVAQSHAYMGIFENLIPVLHGETSSPINFLSLFFYVLWQWIL